MQIRLRKKLEHSVVLGHPWLYRDALEPLRLPAGQEVVVLSRGGKFLARGITEEGPIAVRVWTTTDQRIDVDLITTRLSAASELRTRCIPEDTTTYRLLHGEGDRVPGFVCDLYESIAVLQLDGDGVRPLLPQFIECLTPILRKRGIATLIYKTGRGRERQVKTLWGPPVEGSFYVKERGMRLCVDVIHGQKTGLFLDHRESRFRARQWGNARKVLNLYGYTGGFSVAAGLGGASFVTTVDSAKNATDFAQRSWVENDLDVSRHRVCAVDVESFLKEDGQSYDFIISDPPSFAPNQAAKPKALEAYHALHVSALNRLGEGGLYLAASCSSHVTEADFEETLLSAARSTRRVLQVVDRWGAPADHPTLLAFPEGRYLKAILMRVLGS